MRQLAGLLENLADFSVESQREAVDAWAEQTGKKPWNAWRVCLVGAGKGPLRRMHAAIAALGE